MNYINFCRNYFALTNIPISLLKGKIPVYSSVGEMLSLEIHEPHAVFWETGEVKTNPTFCRYSPEIEYGCLHVEGTKYYIVLGPVFSVPVTEEIINTYLNENQIPFAHREAVADFLYAIPLTSQQHFYRHLISLHMSLNGADIDWDEIFPQMPSEDTYRSRRLVSKMLSDMDEGQVTSSYDSEHQMYQAIRSGDLLLLDDFLTNNVNDISEGVLASSPLRHEKNLFIQSVTKVGVLAGIPAGMGIDQVYRLTELYIQECEKLQSIGEVRSLWYAMLKDFCRRCGEARLPSGISTEVYRCLMYIRSHITESVSISDLADHIGRSASYLNHLFKEEVGISVSKYIMRYKLDIAKELLANTDKTLADISFFLGFSSQSYFQNVFKREFGVTPLQFRKEVQRS
ncbi:MAG: helix-turn-helix transcriptional regulator [Eubacteriales bacterium]|jgi:AraC-like DNA-binding protein